MLKKISKKIALITLCCAFTLLNLNSVSANNTFSNEDYEKAVSSFIYTFEDLKTPKVSFNRVLKDVNDDESFVLLNVGENGYAVVAKDSDMILEIKEGSREELIGEKEYYICAETFLSEDEYIKEKNMRTDVFSDVRLRLNEINKIKANNFEYENSKALFNDPVIDVMPDQLKGGKRVGINESSMEMFAKKSGPWFNSTGICGSIAAATMVTYLDGHVNSNFIKQPYSLTSDDHARWIINLFIPEIENHGIGSTAGSVASGIQRACYKVNNKSTVVGFTTSSESTIKSKLGNGYPVVLELPGYKNDVYGGSHMVCAFAYVDYNGYLWFHATDNWGNMAWINRNWLGKGIYLTI